MASGSTLPSSTHEVIQAGRQYLLVRVADSYGTYERGGFELVATFPATLDGLTLAKKRLLELEPILREGRGGWIGIWVTLAVLCLVVAFITVGYHMFLSMGCTGEDAAQCTSRVVGHGFAWAGLWM